MSSAVPDRAHRGLRFVASLWLGTVVLMLMVIAMACATLVEAGSSTDVALAEFYMATWFQGLLGLLALGVLAALLLRFPFGRAKTGFAITHAAVVVILGGALVTRFLGIDGQVVLAEGEATSQFQTSQERLSLRNLEDGTVAFVDLPHGFGGVHPLEHPPSASVTLGGATASVTRYLPDSEITRVVRDDAPQPRLALEIATVLTAEPVWLFEDTMVQLAGRAARLKIVADAEFDQPPNQDQPVSGSPSVGRLKIELAGQGYEMAAEECWDRPCTIGDSGYTARVLDYFPHAVVGPGGQLSSASARPVNPAVRVELTGNGEASTRLAFANFPEFRSTHGGADASGLHLTFVASATPAAPAIPIEFLASRSGRLALRLNTGREKIQHEVKIGEPIQTPWDHETITVQRRLDHAAWSTVATLPERPRQTRVPALLVTAVGGDPAEVWIQKGQTRAAAIAGVTHELSYRDGLRNLGFQVALKQFTVGYYPGERRPRSFESQVLITDPTAGASSSRVISMNHPTTYKGYTFYQSSYQQTGGKAISVLSVAKDPGKPIVFAGYIALLLGMVWVLVTRMRKPASEPAEHAGNGRGSQRGHSRTINLLAASDRCLNHGAPGGNGAREAPTGSRQDGQRPLRPIGRTVRLLLTASVLTGAGTAAAQEASSLDFAAIKPLCVQHDGRWPPLDTVARDYVQSIAGTQKLRGREPIDWLLAWTFDSKKWSNEPLIPIRNAELRNELALPADRTVFSFAELTSHRRLLELVDDLSRMESGRKMDPLEAKVSDIHEKLVRLQRVFQGQAIRVIPDANNPMAAWSPVGATTSSTGSPIVVAWENLKTAFLAQDAPGFTRASQGLVKAAESLPAAFRPAPTLIQTELKYNRLSPFTMGWRIMLLGVVLAFAAMFVRRVWFDALTVVGSAAGFAVLSYGLLLRWQIAGRIPASNMFESLLFLSWGVGAFAILASAFFRDRLVLLSSAFMSTLALFLADVLPMDHFVRPVAPVLLDTVWMSIHVPIIMASYSVLALAVLIAHVQLVVMALAPHRKALAARVDSIHYWYVFVGVILLATGIITGSMWAASSWGRYWGWDPKEVWSLIALLGYLAVLHVRVDQERVSLWGRLIGAGLACVVFAIVVQKLGPVTTGKVLGVSGAFAGAAILVLARGPFATAAKSVLCFWLIIMTYVGVNYVLGSGLHSYGFGAGAAARSMMLLGAADLALLAIATLVYLLRSDFAAGFHAPRLNSLGPVVGD